MTETRIRGPPLKRTDTGLIEPVNPTDFLSMSDVVISADVDFGGNYALDLQNIQDLNAKGPGYWFNGVDAYINCGGAADLEFDTQFSLIVDAKFDESSITDEVLFGKYSASGDHREYMFQIGSTSNILECAFGDPVDGTLEGIQTIETALTDLNVNKAYGVTFKDGIAVLYGNGLSIASSVSYGVLPTTLFNGNADAQIGSYDSTNRNIKGNIKRVLAFNLMLTDAEMLEYSNGAPIPYKYLGASQTDKVTNGDFTSDLSSWTNSAGVVQSAGKAVYDGTSGGFYQAGLGVGGKLFKLTFDWERISGTLNPSIGSSYFPSVNSGVSGSYSEVVIDDGIDTNLNLYSTGFAGSIDNVKLVQIGCVGQYEPPGIGVDEWCDASGNELHGAVTNAIAINRDVCEDVWVSHELFLDENRSNVVGKPTDILRGLASGYSLPEYAANEELYFRQRVPFRWNGIDAPVMAFITAITGAEDVGDKYKFQLEWTSFDIGAIVPDTITETLTDEVTVLTGEGGAYFARIVTFALTPATLVRGQNLQMRLRRVAASASSVTAEIAVFHWDTRWKVDKRGTQGMSGY